MSDTNGGAPADLVGRLEAELREGIAAEQAARVEHERLVDESLARERRLQRTLNTLTGVGPGRKPQAQAPAKKKWRVSEDRLQAALAALKRQAEPMSVQEVATAMGSSPETARRALDTLREQSVARLAGTERRGHAPATVYALMPTPTGDDDGA